MSRSQLAERRRKLRHQRRMRVLQAFWRLLAVAGMTGGLVWVISQPAWVIRNSSQIVIEGNEFLAAEAIQTLIDLPYPQAIWQVQPQAIAQQLESHAPIAGVEVGRRLFPPALVVRVHERHPVATTMQTLGMAPTATSGQVGLLDAKGIWTPLENYTTLDQSLELPTLKVIGMRNQYLSQWPDFYLAVSQSPVQVIEIDWRDPANLILITELGTVHFGDYGPRFSDQLKALDQMRQISQTISPGQIAYIDLKNPASPLINTLQGNSVQQPPQP